MDKLFLLFVVFAFAYCDYSKPKVYKVDLDVEPELRWKQIVEDHLEYVPAMQQELRSVLHTETEEGLVS